MIETHPVSTSPSWPGFTEHQFACGHNMAIKDGDPVPEKCPEPHEESNTGREP